MNNSLGAHIAFYRKKKGLSEEELGSLLSVSPDLVRDWEKDARIPSPECQNKLAQLFNVPSSFFHPEESKQNTIVTETTQNRGKFIGTCARCGKSIYSFDAYGMGKVSTIVKHHKTRTIYEYEPDKQLGYDYFCADCCREILSLKTVHAEHHIEKMEKRLRKATTTSTIAALITWIVALGFAVFAFFWFDRTFWSYLVAGCSFLLAYLVFSYLYTLLLKSDWISDAFYAVMKAGFKTLPSKVQAEDALGVLKTGFVKAIFLAVSYVATTVLLLVMSVVLSFISAFTWTTARKRYLDRLSSQEAKAQEDKGEENGKDR